MESAWGSGFLPAVAGILAALVVRRILPGVKSFLGISPKEPKPSDYTVGGFVLPPRLNEVIHKDSFPFTDSVLDINIHHMGIELSNFEIPNKFIIPLEKTNTLRGVKYRLHPNYVRSMKELVVMGNGHKIGKAGIVVECLADYLLLPTEYKYGPEFEYRPTDHGKHNPGSLCAVCTKETISKTTCHKFSVFVNGNPLSLTTSINVCEACTVAMRMRGKIGKENKEKDLSFLTQEEAMRSFLIENLPESRIVNLNIESEASHSGLLLSRIQATIQILGAPKGKIY